MCKMVIFSYICWVKPWDPPCVLFGWWFSPWELCGYWLVHIIVPPAGLHISSVPWILSLAASLGTLCSFLLLAVSQGSSDPLFTNTQSIHTLVFLLLEILWSMSQITGIQSFGANTHLSAIAYHVCFCDCVTSLRMIVSNYIHLPKNFMNSLL